MASDARYAYPYSVAPMMGVTDRHWRYFARGLSARTLLYTEMYVDNTLVHNPNGLGPFLGRSAEDEPLALQLGGNDPETLAAAADLACAYTEYVEVNLNCGCPSAVVATRHEFGARMMLDPERTARCVSALVRRVGHKAPVTVKHRLGTDVGGADYATTLAFVMACRQAGARHFVLHARMAVLGVRMSCASNRSVPPLEPAAAHKLRRDVPDCTFAVNGGLQTLVECRAHVQGDWAGEEALPPVDSAMVGRSAWYTPWDTLARADTVMFGAAGNMATTRRAALERYVDYADAMRPDIDTAESHLIAPLHYLFGGESRAKAFRTHLAQRGAASRMDPFRGFSFERRRIRKTGPACSGRAARSRSTKCRRAPRSSTTASRRRASKRRRSTGTPTTPKKDRRQRLGTTRRRRRGRLATTAPWVRPTERF